MVLWHIKDYGRERFIRDLAGCRAAIQWGGWVLVDWCNLVFPPLSQPCGSHHVSSRIFMWLNVDAGHASCCKCCPFDSNSPPALLCLV